MDDAKIDPPWERALAHVAARSTGSAVDRSLRVTLNFHPDRAAAGREILAALAEDGVYYSQFVTGTGNGGLTAYPGGDRWRWESGMFAAAYDQAPARQRPVYGSLNFRNNPFGGSPRFGSAHLRLTEEVLDRTTFCYPDSSADPRHFATADRMSLIERARADARDPLDDYIEAHVHGPVRLDRDVEALVLDPCYRGTEVEAATARLPCELQWHNGFRLTLDELRRHPDYRGPRFVDLGTEIARDAVLDPRAIGDAVRAARHDPQDLKKVWHCLARFGAPGCSATSSDVRPVQGSRTVA